MQTVPTMPLTALRIELLEAYKALISQLHKLSQCVLVDDASLPAWVQSLDDDPDDWLHREAAMHVYQQLLMIPGQEPRECLQRFGAIAASSTTLETAQNVNTVKQRLAQAYKAIKISERDAALEEVFHSIERTPLLKKVLRQGGLSALHVVQATRQIHILPCRPRKVGFTLCKQSAIVQPLSYDEALRRAQRRGLLTAVEAIQNLGPSRRFAIMRKQAPHVRANLTYDASCSTPSPPRQKVCSMPLLYPTQPGEAAPSHNGERVMALLHVENDMERDRRNDHRLLLDKPVSETLRMYVYRNDA